MIAEVASLAPPEAQALVHVIEGAPQVRRRHHFFMWTQGAMQALLPHRLLICGTYQRSRKELSFEPFHSVAVPPSVLAALTHPRSLVMRAAEAAWIQQRGGPLVFDPTSCAATLAGADLAALSTSGYRELLLHGVARPQRPDEVEALFLFASPGRISTSRELLHLEFLLPHLHRAYLRAEAMERELSGSKPPFNGYVSSVPSLPSNAITMRERQILRGVRNGKSNQEIGELLAISPLTVKNHIQKILRKLGAANRAQAVAMAMSLQLLPDTSEPGPSSERP